MSDEDFYVYFITHAYRHYAHAGNGVRAFMDVYVYLDNKRDTLDMAYIQREIKFLGIADFERRMRTVAFKLFSRESFRGDLSLTEEEIEFVAYHIGSGVYGTLKNAIDIGLTEIAGDGNITSGVKFKYFMKRLIPDDNCYMLRYPWAYRHRILIPFAVCIRFFSTVFKKPKKIINEIRGLRAKKGSRDGD
jgi:hypothetical protein